MTNPTPRPALRKAEDADVHPAAPAPVRRPRSPGAAAAETPAASAPTPARRTAKRAAAPVGAAEAAAGPAPVVAVEAPVAAPPGDAAAPAAKATKAVRYATPPAKPTKKKRERTGFTGTTSDHLRRTDAPAAERSAEARKKKAKADAELLSGPLESTKIKLPKKLRKAAEKEAARRGLDLHAVTAELLHTWLTHRP